MKARTDKLVWTTLLVLGGVDLIRGLIHTVGLNYAAANIAGVSDPDAIFLLRTFGLSNYLTGALFIMIALKARELAPYVLVLIPLSYAIGLVVSPPVAQAAQFNGKYMMAVYFAICVVVGVWGIVAQGRERRAQHPAGMS